MVLRDGLVTVPDRLVMSREEVIEPGASCGDCKVGVRAEWGDVEVGPGAERAVSTLVGVGSGVSVDQAQAAVISFAPTALAGQRDAWSREFSIVGLTQLVDRTSFISGATMVLELPEELASADVLSVPVSSLTAMGSYWSLFDPNVRMFSTSWRVKARPGDKEYVEYRVKLLSSAGVQATTGRIYFRKKPFVYVALGDSFQSGEGVAYDLIHDKSAYLHGYENGFNWSNRPAGQKNTYNDLGDDDPGFLITRNRGCHRSLESYPKILWDKFEPGRETVLIDVTCSGALIKQNDPLEDQPSIVGLGPGIERGSQVDQAKDELETLGLTLDDVDLVTVGMGGNDADFGGVISGCVPAPLLKELMGQRLAALPTGPLAFFPETSTLVRNKATLDPLYHCGLLEFRTAAEISNSLPDRVNSAQKALLRAFPSSRVLQMNYPRVIPNVSNWLLFGNCGGIGAPDVIDLAAIQASVRFSIKEGTRRTNDSRLELVDLFDTFGSNPLCPIWDPPLVNPIPDSRITKAAQGMLKDAQVVQFADRFLYSLWPLDIDALLALQKNLTDRDENRYLWAPGLLVDASDDYSVKLRYDMSKQLFHPNKEGKNRIACTILNAYHHRPLSSGCATSVAPLALITRVNSTAYDGASPIVVRPGDRLTLEANGFAPGSRAKATLHSVPVLLGEGTVDDAGLFRLDVQLPDVEPGVHRVVIEGRGNFGDVGRSIMVMYPGRPGVGVYAMHVPGFTPSTDDAVHYARVTVGEFTYEIPVDAAGGVTVAVPTGEGTNVETTVAIVDDAGVRKSTTLTPVPRLFGLWATSQRSDAIKMIMGELKADALVHSNGGIALSAASLHAPRTEISTRVVGSTLTSSLGVVATMPASTNPVLLRAEEFAPGTPAAGSPDYHAIPASKCWHGTWWAQAKDIPSGLVYVPCSVRITTSGTINATIVAQGSVVVGGVGLVIKPVRDRAPAVVASSLSIEAARAGIHGSVHVTGDAKVSAAGATLQCGVLADTVTIGAADVTLVSTPRC